MFLLLSVSLFTVYLLGEHAKSRRARTTPAPSSENQELLKQELRFSWKLLRMKYQWEIRAKLELPLQGLIVSADHQQVNQVSWKQLSLGF